MKAVAATQRTVNAIRKADALPRNLLVKSNRRGVSTTARSAKGGADIYWAKITTVTNNNNYIADIYYSPIGSADETDKKVRVPFIVDSLLVGDYIPVVQANTSAEKDLFDYKCSQQIGAVG